jgi:hypothetical protein
VRGPLLDLAAGRVSRCRCGCTRDAHDHYRAGTDCGRCGAMICPSWRPPGGPIARLIRSIAARL